MLTAGCCRADKPNILRKNTDKDKGMGINTDRCTKRQTESVKSQDIKESLKYKHLDILVSNIKGGKRRGKV